MKWAAFLGVMAMVSAILVVVVRHQNRLEFLQVRSAEEIRASSMMSGAGFSWRKRHGPGITLLKKPLERNSGW